MDRCDRTLDLLSNQIKIRIIVNWVLPSYPHTFFVFVPSCFILRFNSVMMLCEVGGKSFTVILCSWNQADSVLLWFLCIRCSFWWITVLLWSTWTPAGCVLWTELSAAETPRLSSLFSKKEPKSVKKSSPTFFISVWP